MDRLRKLLTSREAAAELGMKQMNRIWPIRVFTKLLRTYRLGRMLEMSNACFVEQHHGLDIERYFVINNQVYCWRPDLELVNQPPIHQIISRKKMTIKFT